MLNASRSPVKDHPRITTPSDDRFVALTARRNQTMPARAIAAVLNAATGPSVLRQPVYRRVIKQHNVRRPTICVPITSRHRCDQYQLCREHVAWNAHQWSIVMFSGEWRFSLQSESRRVFIWRESSLRYNPTFTRELHQHRGGGIHLRDGLIINELLASVQS